MKDYNTISGFHVISNKDGILKLNTKKLYQWHVPKPLRGDHIQRGAIVLARTKRGAKKVVVMDVFREEFEETKKRYQNVINILERAPEQ